MEYLRSNQARKGAGGRRSKKHEEGEKEDERGAEFITAMWFASTLQVRGCHCVSTIRNKYFNVSVSNFLFETHWLNIEELNDQYEFPNSITQFRGWINISVHEPTLECPRARSSEGTFDSVIGKLSSRIVSSKCDPLRHYHRRVSRTPQAVDARRTITITLDCDSRVQSFDYFLMLDVSTELKLNQLNAPSEHWSNYFGQR